jgi:chemotaxis protein methyltransferase CheR
MPKPLACMEIADKDVREFQKAVLENSPYDFSGYTLNSLKRRLVKVLEEYGADAGRLIRTISNDPIALEEVVKKITVNTTELFRDPDMWIQMMNRLLPRYKSHSELHIWHPGCSTGQEVYSMMIVLDQMGLLRKSHIYASDINTDVLEKAAKGTYRLRFNREYIDNYNSVFRNRSNGSAGKDFAPHEKYFRIDEARDRIKMNDSLRKLPAYKKIDLVTEKNLFEKKFDIIICRNVIIYFNYELQNKVLSTLHDNLQSNGALVLGVHESIIGTSAKLFTREDQFYIKRNQSDWQYTG